MVEQGEYEKAKHTLQRIHNVDIGKEFDNLLAATEASKMMLVRNNPYPWKKILERKHRPHLVIAIAIPLFQHLTGVYALMFYAPLFFKTIGFGTNTSLMFAIVIGGVNVASTFLSIILANRVMRRRFLLIAGGVQMFVCQIVVGTLIWNKVVGVTTGIANLVVVAFICILVSGFALSWGPIGWLVPSDQVFPLEIRSAEEGISIAVNMFSFTMTCFKFGLFYIFAFFALTMTLFVIFFLPETKGIPIEEMSKVLEQHWFWRRCPFESVHNIEHQKNAVSKKLNVKFPMEILTVKPVYAHPDHHPSICNGWSGLAFRDFVHYGGMDCRQQEVFFDEYDSDTITANITKTSMKACCWLLLRL
ncbi:Sugar/inositol transporter [Macleaya cordata]|uniref:Sugar/inositol transporter n=1 Tax=Macleaya cordata TaxID=56857 RepID=A0A200RBV0_MACCD|nr:Sugar/inositol transporter [Macleaya cordata]